MVYSHKLWYCMLSQYAIQHLPFMLREKTSFLKKIVASNEIPDAKEMISDPWAKPFEVGDAGEKLFLNRDGGTGNDSLITKWFVLGLN